jgi:hypothetical protein
MHFRCYKFLHQSLAAIADAAIRIARFSLLTTCIPLLLTGSPAQADSRAAGEFTLKTCTDAMADFAKVQAAAGDSGWSVSPQPMHESLKKYVRAWSIWNVSRGDDTYVLLIWESLFGLQRNPAQRVCHISFGHATVRRDEFFNQVAAAMDLRLLDDNQGTMRTEKYQAKLYLPKRIHFSITSTPDGMVSSVSMQEITLQARTIRPDEPLIRPRFDHPAWPRGDH